MFTTVVCADEMRTFTSPDKRTMQAEVVAATTDRVTLKTAAGQTIVAPIDKFIPADQEFIGQWRVAHPVQIKYKFAADYTKSKASSTKSKQGATDIITEMWECNMKIANESGQTLDGVTVDYIIYYNEMERGNKIVRQFTGKAAIGTVKNLQQMVVKTEQVKLETSLLQGGFYYTDGSKTREKDSIMGMTIDMNHDGKKIFSWSSKGAPKGGVTSEGKSESVFAK